MRQPVNIFIAGVGGQGTILAGKIIAAAALAAGYDIKMSEVHGMAQRGGSVVTQVRLAEKVYAPTIPRGEADILLAFEKLEALRWVDYLAPAGVLILNEQEIMPAPVLAGKAEYPAKVEEVLKSYCPRTITVPALSVARECGSSKAANVVLLGVMAGFLPLEVAVWEDAIGTTVAARWREVNLNAFRRGYSLGTQGRSIILS